MPHKRVGHKVSDAVVRLGSKASKPLKVLGSKAYTAAAQSGAANVISKIATVDDRDSG
jgi:hypothetical protein